MQTVEITKPDGVVTMGRYYPFGEPAEVTDQVARLWATAGWARVVAGPTVPADIRPAERLDLHTQERERGKVD